MAHVQATIEIVKASIELGKVLAEVGKEIYDAYKRNKAIRQKKEQGTIAAKEYEKALSGLKPVKDAAPPADGQGILMAGTMDLKTIGFYYEGEFRDGQLEGYGIMRHTKSKKEKDSYTGHFADGLFHGEGKMEYSNGVTYVGQWEHGESQGQGKLITAKGSEYVGTFEVRSVHGPPLSC